MLLYHLRHAVRRLRREPAFTAAAVLTLALGVGANVAVFTVIEALLLRPLPYANADALVVLNHRDMRTGITKKDIAIGDYVDLVARQTAFEGLTAYGRAQATVFDQGEPFRVDALLAGPGLLDLLRVRPIAGRALRAEDSRHGAAPVVLLGYDAWQTRFGGDPRVVGHSITIDDQPRQIVGIAPSGFSFPPNARTDAIVPIEVPVTAPTARKDGWAYAVGRVAPTRTIAQAATNLTTISRQLEKEFPATNRASEYFPIPLRDAMLGDTRSALLLMLAAVGVVLIIACANVANLMLARSLARRREMAVRLALGAGRRRLIAQLLAESFVLASVASLVGLIVASWGARALALLLPRSTSGAGVAPVHIDGMVLAFALGITVLASVVFGLVAVLTVRSEHAGSALASSGRGSTMGAGARRLTASLVATEVALAVVLLVGAGLILRSFSHLMSVDPGFRPDHVMTMDIELPNDRYKKLDARAAFYDRAFARVRAIRGVEAIGTAAVTPLTGNNWSVPLDREEQPVPAGERPPEVGWQLASGQYFATLGIPLVAGRTFDARDRGDAPQVVIVSEAVQTRLYDGQSPVGRRIKLGDQTAEIVGVVGNIRRAGLRDDPRADMYFPFERNAPGRVTLFVRTTLAPEQATPSLRAALREVEPNVVVVDAKSLSEVASDSERITRIVFLLLGIFAATALALAAVGIYGVMSYAVRQRSREIGTRIALGATRADILRLVLGQGATIAVVGTVAGLVAGFATTRFLGSILYGVTATDPITLGGAVAVLVATTMLACWIPARRAAALDPMRTLSSEG